MSVIAPGTSPYLIMTTMATIVNQGQDKVQIKVDATGAATKHMIELAQGKIDIVHELAGGLWFYEKAESDVPEDEKRAGTGRKLKTGVLVYVWSVSCRDLCRRQDSDV